MNSEKKLSKGMNMREETLLVLKTVHELEHAYGVNYLRQILQGEKGMRVKEAHQQLPTFGSMSEEHFDRINNLIYQLVTKGLLEISDANSGTIRLSEMGEAFIDEPEDLWLRPRDLRSSMYDIQLRRALRQIRQKLAKQEAQPVFRIFSNYCLQQIVQQQPTDVVSLKKIPGIGDFKADRYGHLILQAVNQVREKKAEDAQISMYKRANSPSLQTVKTLFESGFSPEVIAEKRRLKKGTVQRYLLTLHQAGEIDLLPWIEHEIEPQTLEKGKTYFQNTQNPRLKDAYEMLGLDYDTLRLCRLYVANIATAQTELRYEYAS